MSSMIKKKQELFVNRLPATRLGKSHDSLDAFREATAETNAVSKLKEYTLIIVVRNEKRNILLGHKNRGFGKGMFNSFGGKVDPGESVVNGACRELKEETNIDIKQAEMAASKVGTQRFTFQNDEVEMVVHLFQIDLADRPADVQECEEITPKWFDDWYNIPLDNMFADDSLWLTLLLSSDAPLTIDGWYHFKQGGQSVNTILHHYLDVRTRGGASGSDGSVLLVGQDIASSYNNNNSVSNNEVSDGGNRDCSLSSAPLQPATLSETPRAAEEATQGKKFSLEQRLFHALHCEKIHSPSIKEFKESYAFLNAVNKFWKTEKFDVVIDVAGGHGALATLFLIVTAARQAVVVDPAQVGNNGVMRAWKSFLPEEKQLAFRHECLRTALPSELSNVLCTTRRQRVLVVACHACQHLSEETLSIATSFGVHAAVMPCCQKDVSKGSTWKMTSKNLQIPFATQMDLLLAGKMMANESYEVRMKCIDQRISPVNRIIMCKSSAGTAHSDMKNDKVQKAHNRLALAYNRAHRPARQTEKNQLRHQQGQRQEQEHGQQRGNQRETQSTQQHSYLQSFATALKAQHPLWIGSVGFVVGTIAGMLLNYGGSKPNSDSNANMGMSMSTSRK